MIRVGRCYYEDNKMLYPSYEGFTSIVVMMKTHSKWYPLSPYFLKDDNGCILENIWQFSKCYEIVPKTCERKSRFDNTIVWEHPLETHIDKNGNITDDYWKWREKGINNLEPIRYPVGFKHRHKCKFALTNDGTKLNYIEARKKIYLHLYGDFVRSEKQYDELSDRLDKGEKLLIIEIDGPHQESLSYYKDVYGVNDDFIEQNTMLVNDENIKIMLNDEKHPFGHGYCLAMALLGIDCKKSMVM